MELENHVKQVRIDILDFNIFIFINIKIISNSSISFYLNEFLVKEFGESICPCPQDPGEVSLDFMNSFRFQVIN